jgi:hypothetical protein
MGLPVVTVFQAPLDAKLGVFMPRYSMLPAPLRYSNVTLVAGVVAGFLVRAEVVKWCALVLLIQHIHHFASHYVQRSAQLL